MSEDLQEPMVRKIKGHELAGEFAALDELLEETEGELTEEIEALMLTLDATAEEKIEKIALVIKRKQAEAAGIKLEEERIAARRKARENEAERLKQYLARVMNSIGKTRVQGNLVTVAFQKNSPSVFAPAIDEVALRNLAMSNPSYVTIVPETFSLNKRAILDAAKTGGEIPAGVEIVQSESLRIR